MKRSVYIAAFTFLGLLFATLLHALIELPTLWLLTSDIEQYGESFVWKNWEVLHDSVSILLWVAGLVLGYLGGVRYWQILYVEERYGKPRF